MVVRTNTTTERSFVDMTFPEIAEIVDSQGSVLVLPIGSLEQHGHHLPVATDSILVDAVAHGAVDRADEGIPVLVSPTVWSGFSPHHTAFGGTLTIGFETLLRLVGDLVSSAIQIGFDGVLLLNGHGGNTAMVNAAVSTLGVEHSENEIAGLTYFRLADPFIDEIRESETGGMGHGGEFETSLMAYLRPDLVDLDSAHSTYRDEPYEHASREMFDSGSLGVYRPFDEYSTTGELGDPGKASAEKGEELFDRLTAELATVITQMHEQSQS